MEFMGVGGCDLLPLGMAFKRRGNVWGESFKTIKAASCSSKFGSDCLPWDMKQLYSLLKIPRRPGFTN
jgi:hypothetical protein